MRFLSLLAVAALSPLATSQTAIVVPSASYPTIQSGIDAAANGQIVRVLAGTYKENIDLKNKDITLVALIGPAATIIDGGQNGITVTIAGGQTRKCLIEGFTVTGGIGTSSLIGGGFHIKGSSPTIRNCIVRGNTNPAYGAGIGLTGSGTSSPTEPLIEDCQILDNVAGGATGLSYASGGGIAGGTSYDRNNPDTPIVRNCHFEGNEASSRGGGIYASYGFGFLIEACTFTRNRTLSGTGLAGGSAIFMSLNSPFTVVNCRVWGNESPSTGSAVKFFNTAGGVVVNSTITANSGGGIGGYNNGGAFGANTTLDVFNSIIWQNGGTGEVSLGGTNPTISIQHSIVTGGYTGVGNLSSDPQLLNGATGNHRLMAGSPAIDAGTATPSYVPSVDFEGDTRPFAAGIDIGADEWWPGRNLLWADAAEFSIGNPKPVKFTMSCPGQANGIYLLLPGLTGTSPGLPLGSFTLPLNIDSATLILLPIVPGLIGNLDASGNATSSVTLAGVPAGFDGFPIHFAALILNGGAFSAATNSETLYFAP